MVFMIISIIAVQEIVGSGFVVSQQTLIISTGDYDYVCNLDGI